MDSKDIVVLGMAIALTVIGFLLTTNETFARWGLTHGRGQAWVRLLGMQRAMKLTRYVLGPIALVFGLVLLAVAAILFL